MGYVNQIFKRLEFIRKINYYIRVMQNRYNYLKIKSYLLIKVEPMG